MEHMGVTDSEYFCAYMSAQLCIVNKLYIHQKSTGFSGNNNLRNVFTD